MNDSPASSFRSLVTGGSGFIGGHLVALLRQQGDSVRILDLEPPLAPLDGVEFIQCSVTDAARVAAAMAGVERVFHLAALSGLWARAKSDFMRVNCEGTRTLFAAAAQAGVDTVVYCSTEAILKPGNPPGAIVDEDIEPRLEAMPGPYCRAKLLGEREAFAAASRGQCVVVVNPTVPLGPGDRYLTPPARMLLGFLNGTYPAYLDTTLNLVDVRDVAAGHIRAAERGVSGRRYVLGGADVPMATLLTTLQRLSGCPMPRRRVPYWLALAMGAMGEFIADHMTHRPPTAPLAGVRLAGMPVRFDSTRARTELGMDFRPLEHSVADAIADFRARGLLGT
ncbi:dihydroflavonol-4-reductase [Litchfieldella qijiaojingensis]|uniref:Dihydroflavonol-4-reductase n=1 Tax=Litchfieldella qijiaojingensis TaxID=980347 RepID=A0ABQ2Z141_9GAMM|nr:NAD-dependent epimerase/dehydratase family protein [Halomonas qijiaojingensis]GGY01635.1 dihydroflavonol-4-reductase [Halomonas qijiaojingensis]